MNTMEFWFSDPDSKKEYLLFSVTRMKRLHKNQIYIKIKEPEKEAKGYG